MPIIIPANSAAGGGFEVSNSLRFNTASSDYLTKTYSTTATSKKILTVSAWVKRSKLGATQEVFSASRASDGYQTDMIRFGSSDQLEFFSFPSTGGTTSVKTTRVFRDTSAWYNIVVMVNTTDNTAADRVRMFVNGVRETSFATGSYPPQNSDLTPIGIASGTVHTVGAVGTSAYFSGYLAEVVYADGQALDATSFGEFDEDSGVWKPIDVSGLTFGNNGFYLQFKQSGTSQNSSGMGADTSGNDNHYAVNNLTALDQTTDTCTNNFATLNLIAQTNASVILKEGNTKMSITGNVSHRNYMSTIAMTSGKWYFEALLDNIGTDYSGSFPYVGVMAYESYTGSQYVGTTGGAGYNPAGYIYSNNGSGTNTGTTYAESDVIGCALDLDNSKIYWSKNGTYVSNGSGTGNPSTGANGYDIANIRNGDMGFCVSGYKINAEWACNFGNPYYSISSSNSDANDFGNFEYAVPSGYLSLNTKNLSEELS